MATAYETLKGLFYRYLGDGQNYLDYPNLTDEFARAFVDQWDDLRAPATALRLPGGASDADVDPNDGTFLFASNTTEQILSILQLPHGYKEGSNIKPHIHWAKTTSAVGGVSWKLEYKWLNNGDTAGAYSSPIEATEATAHDDTAEKTAIYTFGEIDGTGKGLSSIFVAKIYRDHDDADDTYGADARLYEFDIHYQIDERGSAQEFVKDPA